MPAVASSNTQHRQGAGRVLAPLLVAMVSAPALVPAQGTGAPVQDVGADGNQNNVPQEVTVVGERAGPRLWRVTNGEHVLWILGTLDPLPKDMTWRSSEVESVLREVQQVLPSQPAVSVHAGPITYVRLFFQLRRVRTIPGGQTLKDWLSPELYARWAALKVRYRVTDRGIDRQTPVLAAFNLYGRALEAARLLPGPAIQNSVLKLARKRKVQVQSIPLSVDDPRGVISEWQAMPRSAQIDCLEAIVGRLETDLDTIRAQARAWALGDVQTLRKLPYPQEIVACNAALGMSGHMRQLIDAAKAQESVALQSALTAGHATLAVRPIYDLFGADGTLAMLKSAGYTVEGP